MLVTACDPWSFCQQWIYRLCSSLKEITVAKISVTVGRKEWSERKFGLWCSGQFELCGSGLGGGCGITWSSRNTLCWQMLRRSVKFRCCWKSATSVVACHPCLTSSKIHTWFGNGSLGRSVCMEAPGGSSPLPEAVTLGGLWGSGRATGPVASRSTRLIAPRTGDALSVQQFGLFGVAPADASMVWRAGLWQVPPCLPWERVAGSPEEAGQWERSLSGILQVNQRVHWKCVCSWSKGLCAFGWIGLHSQSEQSEWLGEGGS